MEEHPNKALTKEHFEPEPPIQIDVDMVELLVLVVDDLCVQVGELKEKLNDDQTKK
ncbi:hypothetical protein [Lactococcus kimchii]|uniref:hypothetical protein n=1 Tax=Lactococcus sp. S-13 TaxID=2507158 RepID=UPI00168010F2|nr:hypothetical protein [Lactococcus sp. S-13]